MTKPNPLDTTAIGGAHPGAASREEIASKISFDLSNENNLSNAAGKILNAAEWHLNSFTDPNSSPKYAVSPSVSFFGGGAFSITPDLGKFVFGDNTNENNRSGVTFDKSQSSFYSDMGSTTLGSLKIDTVDGYELNPVSPTYPSTNYSPTKPWIKKLIPSFSFKDLMTISILELVQVMLLKAVDKKRQSENFESKEERDIGTIIIDNQNIEDQLFGGNQ